MKAVVCTKYGPPEVLQLREVDKPIPKDNEVLIKVHATTAHIGDTRMRRFDVPPMEWPVARLYLGIFKPRRSILGMELAGEVESVGSSVTQYKPGDRVVASTFWSGFGGYAEYKCIREGGVLAHMPASMTYEEAAAGITSGALSALQVLRKASIQPGQKVLVYGASGSVGTYAVQLAKHFGAEVTGVCSTANLDLVTSLGADRVIDYTQEDFTRSEENYDVVFDAVEKITATQGKALLKQGGIYLDIGKHSGSKANPGDLPFLLELAEAGKLKAVIDRRYPMEEIVEAHRYVERGHKRGHVIINVA